jgi:hypothetical protein
MEHLPTWIVLVALVPLVIAAFLRRTDRAVPALEALALAAVAVAAVIGVVGMPPEAFNALRIGVIAAAWGAAFLLAGALLEAIPNALRRDRPRRPAAAQQPARRPATVRAARSA